MDSPTNTAKQTPAFGIQVNIVSTNGVNGLNVSTKSQRTSSKVSRTSSAHCMQVSQRKDLEYKTKMRRKEIPLRDKLILGPIDKYILYDRFPWKLMIHLLLILFTSMQVMYLAKTLSSYRTYEMTQWNNLFLQTDIENSPFDTQKQIFTIPEWDDFIKQTVENYYTIGESNMLEDYQPQFQQDGQTIQPVECYFFGNNAEEQETFKYDRAYFLTPDNLGPFELPNGVQKASLNNIRSMSMTFNITARFPDQALQSSNCIQWQIIQKHSFVDRAFIGVQLDSKSYNCQDIKANFSFRYRAVWIHVISLIVASFMLVMNIQSLMKLQKIFNKLKDWFNTQHDEEKKPQDFEQLANKAQDQMQSYVKIKHDNNDYKKHMKTNSQVNIGDSRKNSSTNVNLPEIQDVDDSQQNDSFQSSNKQSSMSLSSNNRPSTLKPVPEKPEKKEESRRNSFATGDGNFKQSVSSSSNDSSDDSSTNDSSNSIPAHYDVNDQQFVAVQTLFNNQRISWDDLSIIEKSKLIDKTIIFVIFGNLFTIFGTIFFMFSMAFKVQTAETFIGIGCFLTWATIVRYFRTNPSYLVIFRTLMTSIPIVLRVFAGILPVIIGLAIFNMVIYFDLKRFQSFSSSLACLFTSMIGDNLYDTYLATIEVSLFWTWFNTIIWIFISYTILINIVLAIVTDTYASMKYHDEFEWLKNDEHVEDSEHSQQDYQDHDDGGSLSKHDSDTQKGPKKSVTAIMQDSNKSNLDTTSNDGNYYFRQKTAKSDNTSVDFNAKGNHSYTRSSISTSVIRQGVIELSKGQTMRRKQFKDMNSLRRSRTIQPDINFNISNKLQSQNNGSGSGENSSGLKKNSTLSSDKLDDLVDGQSSQFLKVTKQDLAVAKIKDKFIEVVQKSKFEDQSAINIAKKALTDDIDAQIKRLNKLKKTVFYAN